VLYALFDWLAHDISAFNVFRYLTLRAILGVLTALVICFVVGPGLIRKLTQYKVGQVVRTDDRRARLGEFVDERYELVALGTAQLIGRFLEAGPHGARIEPDDPKVLRVLPEWNGPIPGGSPISQAHSLFA